MLVDNRGKPLLTGCQPEKHPTLVTSRLYCSKLRTVFCSSNIVRNLERSFVARTWFQLQNLLKCFSDDSQHLVCRYGNAKLFDMLANVQVSLTLQSTAPSRFKLGQDAFHISNQAHHVKTTSKQPPKSRLVAALFPRIQRAQEIRSLGGGSAVISHASRAAGPLR